MCKYDINYLVKNNVGIFSQVVFHHFLEFFCFVFIAR